MAARKRVFLFDTIGVVEGREPVSARVPHALLSDVEFRGTGDAGRSTRRCRDADPVVVRGGNHQALVGLSREPAIGRLLIERFRSHDQAGRVCRLNRVDLPSNGQSRGVGCVNRCRSHSGVCSRSGEPLHLPQVREARRGALHAQREVVDEDAPERRAA